MFWPAQDFKKIILDSSVLSAQETLISVPSVPYCEREREKERRERGLKERGGSQNGVKRRKGGKDKQRYIFWLISISGLSSRVETEACYRLCTPSLGSRLLHFIINCRCGGGNYASMHYVLHRLGRHKVCLSPFPQRLRSLYCLRYVIEGEKNSWVLKQPSVFINTSPALSAFFFFSFLNRNLIAQLYAWEFYPLLPPLEGQWTLQRHQCHGGQCQSDGVRPNLISVLSDASSTPNRSVFVQIHRRIQYLSAKGTQLVGWKLADYWQWQGNGRLFRDRGNDVSLKPAVGIISSRAPCCRKCQGRPPALPLVFQVSQSRMAGCMASQESWSGNGGDLTSGTL